MKTHGGKRPGSGRKKELPEGAKPYSFKLTPGEQVQVRDFINQLRSDNMTRYLVSFTNSQGAWLETVEIKSKSANVDYIKNLAKKQSKYQINRDCSVTVFDTATEEYI